MRRVTTAHPRNDHSRGTRTGSALPRQLGTRTVVALVLAATVMGTLFAAQRRASGGIQAPVLTHLTWSILMLRYLPPLFRSGTDRLR